MAAMAGQRQPVLESWAQDGGWVLGAQNGSLEGAKRAWLPIGKLGDPATAAQFGEIL